MDIQAGGNWNGSFKELLDRLEESNMKMSAPQTVKTKVEEVESAPSPGSAYLGPKIWQKNTISLQQLNEEDFFVMNMDDFFGDNSLGKDNLGGALKKHELSPGPDEMRCANLSDIAMGSPSSPGMEAMSPGIAVPSPRPGVIVSTKDCRRNVMPNKENEFLYAESKRAKLEREKEEKRRRIEVEMEFAPEDLALATVPGADFDPRARVFDVEELRPQPIIRKRPKLYVSETDKDDKYWDRRGKNNVAARRSREARRLKENQIALRASYLERENIAMKRKMEEAEFTVARLKIELDLTKRKLSKYEDDIMSS